MTATLVNIRKLLAEVRQSLLEAQKAFNEQTKLLDKKDAELHASLNMLAVAALDERDALRAECERLRGEAEEQANEKVRAIGLYGLERLKSIRLLRACQSLHRAWRRDRVSRGCKHGFRSDCRLGCTDYSCELVRADGRSLAAVEADRDAATQQRDEAREALDLAWGLIANANGGDWTLATPEWRAAAERWRDEHYSKRDTDAGSQMLERERAKALEVKP